MRIAGRRAWRHAGAVAAVALFFAWLGPAAAPLSAQILGLSEPHEVELGRRAAMEIEFDQPMFGDRAVTDYVERLGLRLARKSGRSHLRYRFRVMDTDDVNAFALPGGFIYVTRGLLEAAGSESELAGVLAHEIGHVVGRHHASKIRRDQLTSLGFTLAGPVFGGGLSAIATQQASKAGVRGLFQRFSREQEREADRLGAKNAYDAGYDPRGMVSFFERLAGLRESRPNLFERFFASHPSPEERVDNIGDLIETFPPKANLISKSAAFTGIQERIARLRPEPSGSTSEAAAAILEFAEEDPESVEARYREVAAVYAPLFYQALGDRPRYDYITNFDFDGDWRGDNNWENAADRRFSLDAWIYYNVRETPTHYFLHYAAFHPRDYKGGERRGRWFSRGIRAGVDRLGGNDPTGRARELVLAHENDLEGCLLVVEKHGGDPRDGQVVFVETLAHNEFLKYVPESAPREGFETFRLAGRRVKLYIEPKGHGIEAFRGDDTQLKSAEKGFRLYTFTGHASKQTEDNKDDTVGYDLVPIATTLWPPALQGLNPTYAETEDYGLILLNVAAENGVEERALRLGRLGSAFRGNAGGANLARPPWAWFDGKNPSGPLGQWYFDPARTIRDHFNLGADFSTAYLSFDTDPLNQARPRESDPLAGLHPGH
jgi:Zn-dependent protease with chaperone function